MQIVSGLILSSKLNFIKLSKIFTYIRQFKGHVSDIGGIGEYNNTKMKELQKSIRIYENSWIFDVGFLIKFYKIIIIFAYVKTISWICTTRTVSISFFFYIFWKSLQD